MDAPTYLGLARLEILTTGPSNFAGAATIHSRIIEALAAFGARTTFVGFIPSFHVAALERAGVCCCTPEIVSDAYPNSDALRTVAVTEKLYHKALDAIKNNKLVIFLASFLFPFHQAVVLAAERLREEGLACHVIGIPAGSDIWQIGYQAPGMVRWLLSPERTDVSVVYSRRFACEIRELVEADIFIKTIPPPIDTAIFCPASQAVKRDLRAAIGIPQDSIVLLHCSNLRPVKRFDSILELAIAASATSSRHLLLLVVGPWTSSAAETFVRFGLPACEGLPVRVTSNSLDIVVLGLQSDTTPFHQASDIAINASVHDSFNTSLIESMACGLPVVTSDVVGMAGLVRRYHCGHLFSYPSDALDGLRQAKLIRLSHESVRTAAAFICELAEREDIRKKFSQRSVLAVSNHCGLERVGKQWIRLISRLTADFAI